MGSSGRSFAAGCLVLASLAALSGCYEELEPEQPQARSQTPADAPVQQQLDSGGGSALGGAKRSAENVVGKLEQRSQELSEEFDPYD